MYLSELSAAEAHTAADILYQLPACFTSCWHALLCICRSLALQKHTHLCSSSCITNGVHVRCTSIFVPHNQVLLNLLHHSPLNLLMHVHCTSILVPHNQVPTIKVCVVNIVVTLVALVSLCLTTISFEVYIYTSQAQNVFRHNFFVQKNYAQHMHFVHILFKRA